jgi:hypothetical protein
MVGARLRNGSTVRAVAFMRQILSSAASLD